MSNNVRFIQLESYKSPKITESKTKDWVEFGDKNNQFGYLIDLYNSSTTNSAIINNFVKLAYGKGITARDARIKPNEYARFLSLVSKECLKNVITDAKLLGNYAFQLIYDNKGVLKQVEHVPFQLLRAGKCNEKGEIDTYFYSDNWEDTKKFPPKTIRAYGFGGQMQILAGGNYTVGQKYYSNIDYIGALPYAKLEEEIADYLINEVQNSFSPTTVVNFNNGVPGEEEQELITSKVKGTLTGSNGKKVVVAFNLDETKKTTVDSIPLNDAPDHYRYLSEECTHKIMVGHGVTSPLLFGVATTTGFSSNADELKNSYVLYENMVIKPFQQMILDSLDIIQSEAETTLDLQFVSLQPLTADGELTTQPTPTQLAAHTDVDDIISTELINKGETDLGEEWELIDASFVDYDKEQELDKLIEKANKPTLLARIIPSFVRRNSEQDNEVFRTRYRYVGQTTEKSREFCKKMTAANKLYRKEDIIAMDSVAVNAGWGAGGADTYSIWFYKGGGSCHHAWQRETYRRKGTDITSPLAQTVSPSEQRKEGYIAPVNDKLVYTKPVDMPNNGFLK
jgi:hypothetical protein